MFPRCNRIVTWRSVAVVVVWIPALDSQRAAVVPMTPQVVGVVAAVDLERLLSNEFLTLDRDVGQAFGVVDRERRRQAAVVDPGLAGARLALALQDFRSRGRLAPRQRRFLLFVASG